jgi:hypothetical protein
VRIAILTSIAAGCGGSVLAPPPQPSSDAGPASATVPEAGAAADASPTSDGRKCVGQTDPCATLVMVNCEAIPRCRLVPKCRTRGDASACEGLDEQGCAANAACEPGSACVGDPISCELVELAACAATPGCHVEPSR